MLSSSPVTHPISPFQSKIHRIGNAEACKEACSPEGQDNFWELSPEQLAQQTKASSHKPISAETTENLPKSKPTSKEENKKGDSIQSLDPSTEKESRYRTIGRYALAVANAGILAQNLASVSRSALLDQTPQVFNLTGSMLNLASCFVAPVARLPMFVAGTSFFMGGAALAQSHSDQCDVTQTPKTNQMYHSVMQGKWDSSKEFPHPFYQVKTPEGKTKGMMHMVHPGAFASMARNEYFKTFYPLLETLKKPFKHAPLPHEMKLIIPSSIASGVAGVKQLGWMVGKMATNWRFAHDALQLTSRKEFLKGTEYPTVRAPSYVLALGAVLPITMLGGALLYEGGKKVKNNIQHQIDSKDPANMSAAASVDTPAVTKTEDPFEKKRSNAVKLVANASSIIPQVANALFLLTIWREGGGKPLHIMPSGLPMEHAITPRLNAGLIGIGSLGSAVSAGIATLSDLALLPRYVAYLADIAFMAFSGITSVGIGGNTFETNFRITQAAHLFPTPDPIKHMRDLQKAQKNPFFHVLWKGRHPNLPDIQALRDSLKGPPKR
jgi:hypothetical protein